MPADQEAEAGTISDKGDKPASGGQGGDDGGEEQWGNADTISFSPSPWSLPPPEPGEMIMLGVQPFVLESSDDDTSKPDDDTDDEEAAGETPPDPPGEQNKTKDTGPLMPVQYLPNWICTLLYWR
jgi:hypothetical protein